MKKGPNLTERMVAVKAELVDLNQRVGELASNLNDLLGSLTKLETWIPSVDTGIQALNKAVEGIAARVTVLENSPAAASGMTTPTPIGHGETENHQGDESKALAAQDRFLVKGKSRFPNSPITFDIGESSVQNQSSNRFHGPRLPKSDFPKFDGDNPKLWKKNSEKYFEMYQVSYENWAKFSTLHFVGNAALWLQTNEALHSVETWPELCIAVHSKFGKDKYQEHLEELEGLRLIFVGGLKTEIKAAIKLHRPRTVDTALSLAKTQEELVLELKKGTQKLGYKQNYKSAAREYWGMLLMMLEKLKRNQNGRTDLIHVSLLKKAIRPDVQVQADLPANCMAEDAAVIPEEILHRQLIKRGKSAVPNGLVRWTGLPAALAKWENLRQLQFRFPSSPAWGQASS
ncbi:Os10g0383200 [Oryza sativa Japonica Group]|uniref:Os10g0383200 protein n=1 Tax=Oryza sativa subsp. japonica TaxID=39947 RepID=C7J7D7_ORYSJ|nr:Os10g0383200 [Oryza sativa Japonica Group]|eukprot:NP_001176133.1 Os10g0383200 [Oryza sativa Japonica Group]